MISMRVNPARPVGLLTGSLMVVSPEAVPLAA